MLGLPGAGKGTQAEILSEREGFEHISSGAIFRNNLENQTDLGKIAEGYLQRGELVPDDVTIQMVDQRIQDVISERGFLLDGFPRTLPQAKALDEILRKHDENLKVQVVYINVPEEELVDRLTGRLTCRAAGHIFHRKFNPPREAGRCDYDGSELYQREDDQLETVKNRIRVYMNQTSPLVEYYRKQGTLVEVNGDQNVQEVAEEIQNVVERTI
jgi:adenylate kinase